MAPLADGRVRQARHELRRPAARRTACPTPSSCKTCEAIAAENGCTVKLHRRREGRLHRRRRHLHRRVGVHGRARRGVGRAHRASRSRIRVTKEVMAMANPDAIFLHCLPAFHDTNTTIGADIAEQLRRHRDGSGGRGVRVQGSPRSSTRPRTACTPSRPSCTPPSAANLPQNPCRSGATSRALCSALLGSYGGRGQSASRSHPLRFDNGMLLRGVVIALKPRITSVACYVPFGTAVSSLLHAT